MILLYLIALIPAVIGIVLYVFHKEVIWIEWLMSTGLAFFFSAMTHIIVIVSMTADTETWSGKLDKAIYYPQWVERYTDTHTYTTGSGKHRQTHTRTETHYRTHPEHWNVESTLEQDQGVEESFYKQVVKNFGNKIITERASKSGFVSGDHNIYKTTNETKYVYPVTAIKSWENRIKASPSVFSFTKVPQGIKVFDYPKNKDWLKSDRVLGGSPISILEFDRMNSRLGFSKKVNVILIYFGNQDSSISKWQQSAWIGGKKNDLVLCYGGSPNKAEWSFVFGWTEKEVVKRNLETILLCNPIDDSILPLVEEEIRKNYVIKNWHDFDYLSIEPPTWCYIVLILLVLVSQFGFWCWAITNESSKTKKEKRYDYRQRS